uniref:Uncharacterized protein n=1 Tax=Siphoviridae sp. ctHeV6 TaxID=2826233 RepID=A0A8S5MCE4_9CAUD|nr:MAG TPA: hypothetical protein [Siphoviridae sp. ctHeV6]
MRAGTQSKNTAKQQVCANQNSTSAYSNHLFHNPTPILYL